MIDIFIAISGGFLLGTLFTDFIGSFKEEYEDCDISEI